MILQLPYLLLITLTFVIAMFLVPSFTSRRLAGLELWGRSGAIPCSAWRSMRWSGFEHENRQRARRIRTGRDRTELALTPTEGNKSAEQVLPDDRADREIKASHYRFKRSWTIATVALAVYGLWATEGMVWEAHKPPERIYVRVMPNGEFVQSKLTDYHYVPRPNDAELLSRTMGHVPLHTEAGHDHEGLSEELLVSGKEPRGADDGKRCQAQCSGEHHQRRIPENQVESVHADILGFETRTIDDIQIGRGEALIDVILLFPEQMTEPHPRRVHLRVGVAFVLNPAQVQEKALLWPEYPKVNGAGLTIVKTPMENAVESK